VFAQVVSWATTSAPPGVRFAPVEQLRGLACADLARASATVLVDKHNRHHSHPTRSGRPDVGAGVISWTAEQAGAKTGLGRVVASTGRLFFPWRAWRR